MLQQRQHRRALRDNLSPKGNIVDFFKDRPLHVKVVGGVIVAALLCFAVYAIVDYNSPESRYQRCQQRAEDIAAEQHVSVVLVLMSSDHGCGDAPAGSQDMYWDGSQWVSGASGTRGQPCSTPGSPCAEFARP